LALKLKTAPAAEPVTLAEAKTHLRVDISDDDDLITALITAAREYCENFQNRAYITQVWKLWMDDWPEEDDYIEIPLPPLQSVESVKYYDTDGNENTFSSDYYSVDTESEPGRVYLNYGETWPTDTLRPRNGIVVEFTAGYGDTADDVPQTVKQAMLLLIAHWYENREATLAGTVSREVEFAVGALLWQNRVVPV